MQIFRNQQSEDFLREANTDAIQRLEWVYLKLLVARSTLDSGANAETEKTLRLRIGDLEASLHVPDDQRAANRVHAFGQKLPNSEALRQSKSATLEILKGRLANIRRREQSLAEIDSDLTRIEEQVDLMIENATIQNQPQTIGTDIELATNLSGASLFGDRQHAVDDLDQAFSAPRPIAPSNAPRAPERN